jgi:hypothetical protein
VTENGNPINPSPAAPGSSRNIAGAAPFSEGFTTSAKEGNTT